jgi:hypothetical protein
VMMGGPPCQRFQSSAAATRRWRQETWLIDDCEVSVGLGGEHSRHSRADKDGRRTTAEMMRSLMAVLPERPTDQRMTSSDTHLPDDDGQGLAESCVLVKGMPAGWLCRAVRTDAGQFGPIFAP